MNKEEKYKYFGELFCDDCQNDDEVSCPRNKDVICLFNGCGKSLCGYHMIRHQHRIFKCCSCGEIHNMNDMIKHLEEKHLISCSWKGV